MIAVAFGILASLCFAASSLLAQRGLHVHPTPWGAWITLLVNSLFLFVMHRVVESAAPLFATSNWVFVAVGLFVPGVTRVLTFRGIRTMGSAVTSTVVNTTPMFSVLLAILLLGERPATPVILGVGTIVAGLVTISSEGAGRGWKRIELVFPLLCAWFFALKDVTVRWGLSEGQSAPILAAAIAAATSTIEIFVILHYFQGIKFALPPAGAARWFVISGLFTGGSFLFMFLALSMEHVSIVAPLVNSYAVFVLLLTPVMARQIERVTPRKVTGAALVVAGIFLISLGRS